MHESEHMQDKSAARPQYPPLCTAEGVKARLGDIGRGPVQSLGQNFLIDGAARDALIGRAPLNGAAILEIGPGLGALTEGVLGSGARGIVAVEKDAALAHFLLNAFMDEKRLFVLNADILRLPLHTTADMLHADSLYVVGSLPYYITSPILLRLLNGELMISGMTLVVQAEAAARFFAQPGEEAYGPLAVAAQCAFRVERGEALSPAAFYPQPKVRSQAVHLLRETDARHAGFVDFLKAVFAMRRKTLFNNLLAAGFSKENAERLLHESGVRQNARAEALSKEALMMLWENAAALTASSYPMRS